MRILEINWKHYSISLDIFIDIGFWALPMSICYHNHIFAYHDGRGNIVGDIKKYSRLESFIIRFLCIGISLEYWDWRKENGAS